jgi:hypothetical protein
LKDRCKASRGASVDCAESNFDCQVVLLADERRNAPEIAWLVVRSSPASGFEYAGAARVTTRCRRMRVGIRALLRQFAAAASPRRSSRTRLSAALPTSSEARATSRTATLSAARRRLGPRLMSARRCWQRAAVSRHQSPAQSAAGRAVLTRRTGARISQIQLLLKSGRLD